MAPVAQSRMVWRVLWYPRKQGTYSFRSRAFSAYWVGEIYSTWFQLKVRCKPCKACCNNTTPSLPVLNWSFCNANLAESSVYKSNYCCVDKPSTASLSSVLFRLASWSGLDRKKDKIKKSFMHTVPVLHAYRPCIPYPRHNQYYVKRLLIKYPIL